MRSSCRPCVAFFRDGDWFITLTGGRTINAGSITSGGTSVTGLEMLLKSNPKIEKIYLYLDNDTAGRNATRVIQNNLSHKYKIVDRPPRFGKDINDYLCHKLGLQPQRKRSFER